MKFVSSYFKFTDQIRFPLRAKA